MNQTAARFALYSYWRTSATYRVRVALNLKKLASEEINVDIDKNEQREPAFLAINPLGAIPALIDRAPGASSLPITQSLAILEFLEEIEPDPALLPADPWARARVRALAGMMATDTHPLITPRIKKYLTAAGGFDDAKWRAWQTNWFSTGLGAYEECLTKQPGSGRYSQGDSITIADICLASVMVVARVFKIEVTNIPTIDRIMADLESLPEFARADPRRQAGAPAAA
jgi:maleylacetoacetate isomerase/maleylpyruvate isomerase